jgi:hypothetical protein
MKWILARHLSAWAERIDARIRLSEIIAKLVRASVTNISAFRFPAGDSAQIPGYDGQLTAIPADMYREFLADGESVWEFGTTAGYYEKANEDYRKRTESPGESVDITQTTFVFVTPHVWSRDKPTLSEWVAQKRAEKRWKDVRVLDAVALENWFELCSAVAATIAREIIGNLPITGALSTDEFWKEYSTQFQPQLNEEVLLAGRQEQRQRMVQMLMGSGQVHRWQGDSLAEVLAFAIACIRKAEPDVRNFLESKTLFIESKDAARQLADSPHLIFMVRGEAVPLAGRLSESHPVIVPLGRDSLRNADATRLKRPTTHEMAEALKTMGLADEQSKRIARECDRSTTILARRIASAVAQLPSWHKDLILLPALLAGAWDSASPADCAVVARLANAGEYTACEASLRSYLLSEDGPLEREGTVWAIRAPVDVFVHLAPLFGTEHLNAFGAVVKDVFAELDPALDLSIEDRPFAQIHGAVRVHTNWIRDGLATALLTIAALGEKNGFQLSDGRTPRQYVDDLLSNIPGLRNDHRVIASLSNELPLLMEAAPDPLLAALEHLLKGDALEMRAIFQDARDHRSLFSHSPHTGLLWALELIAWDPEYLTRTALVLARLEKIDPGGSLSNRPIESLRHIFLAWNPATNASLRQRLGALDRLIKDDVSVGWKLLIRLLPRGNDFGGETLKPRFREAGASEREIVTNLVVLETYKEIIQRAIKLAGAAPERWESILDLLHAFPRNEQRVTIGEFQIAVQHMTSDAWSPLWQSVNKIIRHHRAHPGADWSLQSAELEQLEAVAKNIAPVDPIRESLWLFEETMPEIPFTSAEKFWDEVEQLRRIAVSKVWAQKGLNGVLELASLAKAPRYVGFALGYVITNLEEAITVISSKFIYGENFQTFAALFSLAIFQRFKDSWEAILKEAHRLAAISDEAIVQLFSAWPHRKDTWNYVESFGESITIKYWQSRFPWGLEGQDADVEYAVRRYLDANRAEFIVEGLYPKISSIPTSLILTTLDQFETRIASTPGILHKQALDFDLQQVFAILQARTDVSLAEIAMREYRFLPLLRDNIRHRSETRSLVLDQYMAENAEFYVGILCDVFRPTSERGKEKDPSTITQQQQLRAKFGWTLLEGFTRIPGLTDNQIDIAVLQKWVAEVKQFASEKDRLIISEHKIGSLLAHAPDDPKDSHWPHKGIRDCLEIWQADEIEQGMAIKRLNMRGATWRDPKQGGKPEHDLAAQLRDSAHYLEKWPRTQKVLLSLAQSWEDFGNREDLRVRQEEMREG